MANGEAVEQEYSKKLEGEIEALKKALEQYVHCRHGQAACNCTNEARAALYPYLAKAAKR